MIYRASFFLVEKMMMKAFHRRQHTFRHATESRNTPRPLASIRWLLLYRRRSQHDSPAFLDDATKAGPTCHTLIDDFHTLHAAIKPRKKARNAGDADFTQAAQ